MKILQFFLNHLQKDYTSFNPYHYETGDVIWANMPLNDEELKHVLKGHEKRPYLIISVNNEEKNYIALEGTSYKGKLLPHSYKIDKSIYNINKSSIFKYKFVKLKDQNILNYFFKLKDSDIENILTNMVKDKYVNLNDLKNTEIYKKYKNLLLKKGSIIKTKEDNYYLIIKSKKNKITLFDVSFNDLHEDNKHYKYNNYQIIYGNLKNINDLEEIDVIDIIPDNIVNTIIKNNNINNEETTKDKEIATLKDFIVYKKNFYIIEDKYENILVCRNLNTNIKKYINCYEDYTIMNKNPQRKRS